MAWRKGKLVIAVVGITAIVIAILVRQASNRREQRLPDGSILVLNRVSFGATNEFTHGSFAARLLGNIIPANGLHFWSVHLFRPARREFGCPSGKSQMIAEFHLVGTNAANHPLAKPGFYREFRCVIRGESGIEYVQEFWSGNFWNYGDGYIGYVVANRYPRDSRTLWLRIERREKPNEGGPWKRVAEFSFKNGGLSTPQSWKADAPNSAKKINGLEFSLGQMTVITQAFNPRDIWNHVVTAPFQVRSNGLLLTNWGAAYVRVADTSGNWDYNLASHRSLDPRYVWKLDADFEPESDFSPENLLTVNLPPPSSSITVNLMNTPVRISWEGDWINASMPTNRTDLALKFVCVTDEHGRTTSHGSGSWGQNHFRKGSFMMRNGDVFTTGGFRVVSVTIAIVPNVHTTFYAQPKLLNESTVR